MGHGDVERLCVCGAFGEHLAPARAQAIGLLPPVASSCIELHGHAALTGAEAMLVRRDPTATWTAITSRARVLNLAHAPGYEDAFIAHLALRPVASQEAVEC